MAARITALFLEAEVDDDDEEAEFYNRLADEMSAIERESNPGKRAFIGAAVGVGIIAGALVWWWLRPPPIAVSSSGQGYVLCPKTKYDGTIRVGDYVVIQLRAKDINFTEATWAEVQSSSRGAIQVRIAGESSDTDLPQPLASEKHGFKIGDVLTIDDSCVIDRFRPGQIWTVLCGPSLSPTGYSPISTASLISKNDLVMVVVRGPNGGTEALWVKIGSVSSGHQVISGVVLYPTEVQDHGVQQGDVLDFLRDCVVDAKFGEEG